MGWPQTRTSAPAGTGSGGEEETRHGFDGASYGTAGAPATSRADHRRPGRAPPAVVANGVALSAALYDTTMSAIRAEIGLQQLAIAAEHGIRALEMPKRATAVHEAGHAVMFAAEGVAVLRARIKGRRQFGKMAWGGRVDVAVPPWASSPDTDPAADLQRVRFTLAGISAEELLARDHRRVGSSIDEIVLADQLCTLAASKLNCDAADLLAEQRFAVGMTLLTNRSAVLALADALERSELVRGARLQAFLADVHPTPPITPNLMAEVVQIARGARS